MTNFEIIQIVVGTGVLGGVVTGIFKLGKLAKLIETMSDDISELKKDVANIKVSIQEIDSRLTVVETILALMGMPVRHKKNQLEGKN